MIHAITFTDSKMTISADRLKESALRNGCDSVKIYRETDLDPFFMAIQAKLFEEQQRYAWYCWKPYAVLDAILKASIGDYLIYFDAGNEVISSVLNPIGAMTDDIMLFGNGWLHKEWCKMDVMAAINGATMTNVATMSGDIAALSGPCDTAEQVQASTMIFRVTERSRKFVKEWYAWSLMPGMIDNEPSILPNVPTFAENRWDQSILCSLQIKWGLPLHWFPSETNMHNVHRYPPAGYPILCRHHRLRNSEY